MYKKIISISTLFIILLLSCTSNSLEELSSDGDCGTLESISYDTHIRPLINISCNMSGCHNQGTVTTFSLASYEDLKKEASSDLFLKSINHESGAVPMPKGVSKLSECSIAKITAWINKGLPNN